ncbi:MAG: HD-GYP domain-containing protein [Senegalia sp. (in: firmicutes)]|uniref:HD-GYP domain-containing protein n=1 Tax=Senegalia sp. (in: firmicutes) TaxID=1924098 RepID=UPI003F9CCF9F
MPISFVKEGTILGKDIYNEKGKTLLSRGTELSKGYINRIKALGIYSIYIMDEYSDQELSDVISPQIRSKAMIKIKETYDTFEKDYNKNKDYNKKAINRANKNVTNIANLAEDLLDDILAQKDVMVNLVDIKSTDNYTYQHCLNVSILSIILGLEVGLKKEHLKYLAIGSLLHDIGKTLTPKEILNKEGPLTDKEFSKMKKHTLDGYEYLKMSNDIPSPARIIALEHHEKIDGSGYPRGLKEDKIYFLSKIVAICDVYDALTSDRPYRPAMSPNDALEFLYANCTKHFDIRLVKKFSNRIIPYPIGTMVQLSDKNIGVIEDINTGFPLRPKIKILSNNCIIDLLKEKNLVIEHVIYDKDEAYA